jgi:WD40 repeat protein
MKTPLVMLRLGRRQSESIQFSPDDRLGVFGDALLDLQEVWEAFDHPRPRKPALVQAEPVPGPYAGWGTCLQLSPDGQRLFVNRDGDWYLWDLTDQQLHSGFRSVPGHLLAVSPEGRLVAVATSFERAVRLVDVESVEVLATLPHSNGLRALAFSPRRADAGHLLATMTEAPSKVRVWDVGSRTCVAEFKAFPGRAVGMCFHPSGRFLIVGGTDGQIRCYDTLTFRETERLDWQVGKLQGLAISPDGLTAAVVGQQRGVLIWDLDDLLPL